MMRIASLAGTILALATMTACTATPDPKISAVESSLAEFRPPTEMFLGDPVAAEDLHTLADRMAHYAIPGVSIALIEDFEIAWTKGYGETKRGSGTPVDAQTLFEAASTTKLLVSAIVLDLVEEGQLDLDADVNDQLKAWKVPENEFTREESVTLRRLLTHRAGLNRPDGGFDSDGTPTLVQTLRGEAPALNPAAVVLQVPGSEWMYSNFGYLVIQLRLEELLGTGFPEIARTRVFETLNMNSSTLSVPLSEEWAKREAVPHDVEGVAHAPQLDPNAVANGGLMTTPSDLALFTIELMKAYQGETGRILSPATARSMFESEIDIDVGFGFPLREGLGVLLCGEGEELAFLHPGDNFPGASSWLIGFPALGKGAVIMTNGARGNMLALEIVYAITQEYGWPTSPYAAD